MNALPATATLATDSRGDLGGLIALVSGRECALPLTRVSVRTSIAGAVARTEVEQVFHNSLSSPMEAVHIFPIPSGGVVTEVQLRCGELTVEAECRAREEAERSFAAAREAGHRAALLTAEREDVHTLRVTRLPPGESVRVRIVIMEVLKSEDGTLRWRFPTVVAPRYMPGRATGQTGPGVAEDTDRVPDASRISPPLRLEGGTPLDLEVSFVGTPARLSSSLHALRVDLDGGGRVAPNGTQSCNRDFVLAFSWAGAEGGQRAWTDGHTTLFVVEPPAVAASPMPRDAVFLVDISGSMDGQKLAAAKRALRTALRGLVPGDRMRLIAFDDAVECHTTAFTPFDDSSLRKAETFVARLKSRGGTEMLAPIREALAGERPAGRLRTVLLITDGQAGNEGELVAAVGHRREGARFFTLGIDTAVNAALLETLARVGGGACTLCTPADDIESVVAGIEARFGSPVADEVRVEGEAARPEGRTLFAGQPVAMLVRGAPAEVVARGRTAAGEVRWSAVPERSPFALGTPWAKERIQWLEDRLALRPFEEEAVAPEIRRIALEAGVASRFTAFVAVERTRRVDGQMQEVVQPVELPAMWVAEPAPPPGGGYGGGVGSGISCAAPDWLYGVVPSAKGAPAPRGAPSPRGAPAPQGAPPRDEADEGAAMPALMMDALMAPPAEPPSMMDRARGLFGGKAKKSAGPAAAAAPTLAELVQRQEANGSWANDPLRTAAALLALLREGHTRQVGLRKRAVQKAALWLAQHTAIPEVAEVLAALAAVEAGGEYRHQPPAALRAAGPEGAMLG
jgi:Ca-activated chloride channel family protein